jgi:germination protein YpeB
MGELDTALQKGMYATSPCMVSSLCTQIYGKAMTAQLALGQLPYSNVELEQTASFIAKAGDYALALSRISTLNGGLSGQEQQGLVELASVSGRLSQTLQNLQAQIYRDGLNLEDVPEAQTRLSQATESGKEELAGSTFQTMEADFPELPSLIYDGPFSEHLTGRSPLALEGLSYVDRKQAATAAGDFLGMSEEDFTLVSAGEGCLPTWGFSAPAENGELYIEVSQTGGKIVSLFTSGAVPKSVLTKEQGVAAAGDFLKRNGFEDMQDTYWVTADNKITVNFAPVIDGIVIYPDLVKVAVALDDGDVAGFEASGYLSNHTERQLPAPAVSADTAREKVSGSLNVLSCRLALIPPAGEYEVMCYEFKCAAENGQHVLVYVNTSTGEQEKILLLLEDETGTLVIYIARCCLNRRLRTRGAARLASGRRPEQCWASLF